MEIMGSDFRAMGGSEHKSAEMTSGAKEMDKIIFLDRDGTINREVNYLHKPEDLEFLPGAAEAMRLLKEAGFKLVVITNQAGVARGYYGCEDVERLHEYMNGLLKPRGAGVDAYYYCPHHPVHGIGSYKTECRCRKPGTGMFEMAERDFLIDKPHSYMIGDKLIDVEAGVNYGVAAILVGTGYGAAERQGLMERKEKPLYDFYAKTLMDAARYIIAREAKTNESR